MTPGRSSRHFKGTPWQRRVDKKKKKNTMQWDWTVIRSRRLRLFDNIADLSSPWTIVVRSVHQSVVSQLSGRDLVDVQDAPGSDCERWLTTCQHWFGLYTLHGVEHRTDLTGEHWQLRSTRGMLLMMMMTMTMTMTTGSSAGLVLSTVQLCLVAVDRHYSSEMRLSRPVIMYAYFASPSRRI